jgi:peptidoglycan/xylan/chitin deacetylase (PgdA/CDA1 family)
MKKYALFSCDTEFTPPWNTGTWEDQDPWTFLVGIDEILKILSSCEIRGTFFCEGTLVEAYPDKVKLLAQNHLIGSHGFNHENYGGRPVTVWTKSQPVFIKNDEEKKRLIDKAIKTIQDVTGKKPEVFVAPFDWIDGALLKILDELNFKIDCSFHNYSLGLPTKFYRLSGLNILELPLSVIFCGELKYKNVLEAFTYDRRHASAILEQEIILITCHPYEFTDIKIPHPPEVLIVGEKKKQALSELLLLLKRNGYDFVDPLQLKEVLV